MGDADRRGRNRRRRKESCRAARLRLPLVLLALASSATSRPLLAKEFPTNIGPIELADALWQVLPDAVEAVFVGPDDRVWYQLEHPAVREDLAVVRRTIEDQFRSGSPQVFGAQPVLFEESGRVWFLTHSRTALLGYDGQQWIERPALPNQFFTGNCPNHGRRYRHGCNLESGGARFFPDSHGVHTFDGHNWQYERMVEAAVPRGKRIVLRAEPDKTAVLAVVAGPPPALWRRTDNQWRRADFKTEHVEELLPSGPDGIWLITQSNGLEFLPYERSRSEADGFPVEFARLVSAGTDEERQRIGDAMTRHGATAREEVERAMGRTYEHEVLKQLVRVLETLAQGSRTARVGAYEVGKVHLLHCEEGTGRCFLRADSVSRKGEALGKGLLILEGTNAAAFFSGEGLLKGWLSAYSEASGPIAAPDGRRIWLETWSERKAALFDIGAGAIVDSIPTPDFRWIHAVRRDGTVFVATREPGQSSAVLAAYRPNRSDSRAFLSGSTQPLKQGESGFCVDSAGAVWAVLDDGGTCRFSDGQWRPVPELIEDTGFTLLIPGARQRLIGKSGKGFFYWSPESFARHGGLKELAAANREEVVAHFTEAPDDSRCIGTFVTGVVADRTGNIWLLESRALSVLIDGKWVSAKPALLATGSRLGEVEYVNTVGGRNRVYVTDFLSVHSGGRSHFGRVEDGRPVFSTAPHTCDPRETRGSVRDVRDRLWLAGSARGSGGTCDWITGQLAQCLTDAGVDEELSNEGWAKLRDSDGSVWLGQVRGGPPDEFRVWRNGSIADRIRVPTADETSRLVSDKPGSVYVWTASGLYHLTRAEAKSGSSGGFGVERMYTLRDAPGRVEKIAVGANGWLALGSSCSDGARTYWISMVRLPGWPAGE